MDSDPSWQGSECTAARNKHDSLDDDEKKTRTSLTTDLLTRYNAGTEPLLYSGVTLFVQDFDDEGSLSGGQFDPLSWLNRPRPVPLPAERLYDENALDFTPSLCLPTKLSGVR